MKGKFTLGIISELLFRRIFLSEEEKSHIFISVAIINNNFAYLIIFCQQFFINDHMSNKSNPIRFQQNEK